MEATCFIKGTIYTSLERGTLIVFPFLYYYYLKALNLCHYLVFGFLVFLFFPPFHEVCLFVVVVPMQISFHCIRLIIFYCWNSVTLRKFSCSQIKRDIYPWFHFVLTFKFLIHVDSFRVWILYLYYIGFLSFYQELFKKITAHGKIFRVLFCKIEIT